MRKCKECGDKLPKDSHKKRYFCSNRCVMRNYNKRNKEKVILRKEAQKNRKLILDVKGRFCNMCGSNDKLIIHHITYLNNDIDNLMILCIKCHNKLHNELEMSSDEEWLK